jgi:sugar/nucleoside kinase (ribokinase family)
VTSIAAIGNLSLDRVAGAPPRPGGPVFYSARALAHLAADAVVAASCSEADRSQLLPPLEAFGLPVRWYASETTTAYRFHYAGETRIMTQDAVGAAWSSERAVEAAAGATWIHVGALVRTDFPAETLAALAAGGRRLLIDAQGLVRTASLGPLRTDSAVGDALRHVQILKLDDQEAETLVGGAEAERLRALHVPEVLLTLGSRGSVVVTPDLVEHVPAVEMGGPVDPTGAGDTFSAAYLAGRAAGADPIEAARVAAEAVAALFTAGT